MASQLLLPWRLSSLQPSKSYQGNQSIWKAKRKKLAWFVISLAQWVQPEALSSLSNFTFLFLYKKDNLKVEIDIVISDSAQNLN